MSIYTRAMNEPCARRECRHVLGAHRAPVGQSCAEPDCRCLGFRSTPDAAFWEVRRIPIAEVDADGRPVDPPEPTLPAWGLGGVFTCRTCGVQHLQPADSPEVACCPVCEPPKAEPCCSFCTKPLSKVAQFIATDKSPRALMCDVCLEQAVTIVGERVRIRLLVALMASRRG